MSGWKIGDFVQFFKMGQKLAYLVSKIKPHLTLDVQINVESERKVIRFKHWIFP